jgi:thiosulfate/3-mercaptopyruvate sulfurtransferase
LICLKTNDCYFCILAGDVKPLVKPKWVADQLQTGSNMVVLDTSWDMSTSKLDAMLHFEGNRVPGSRLFQIDDVCDKQTNLPHMLPSAADFAKSVGRMGIDNDTHVVCYDSNPHFTASARVWWMFRYFGHDKISLMDGGLDSWIVAGLPTQNTAPKSPPVEAQFKIANVREYLLKDLAQIKANIAKENFLLIDARSPDRFRGTVNEPRPGLASGHIPGSINIPYKRVIDGYGSFANETKMRELLTELELNPDQPLATSCGSGVTAAIVAFAFYLIGHPNVAIYDGSFAEYGQVSLKNKISTGLY